MEGLGLFQARPAAKPLGVGQPGSRGCTLPVRWLCACWVCRAMPGQDPRPLQLRF